MLKKGRDNPTGLTSVEALEDIADFPLRKEMSKDDPSSYSEGYAAWRNQRFAQYWLEVNGFRSKD